MFMALHLVSLLLIFITEIISYTISSFLFFYLVCKICHTFKKCTKHRCTLKQTSRTGYSDQITQCQPQKSLHALLSHNSLPFLKCNSFLTFAVFLFLPSFIFLPSKKAVLNITALFALF